MLLIIHIIAQICGIEQSPDLWDRTKRYHNPKFVIDLVTSVLRSLPWHWISPPNAYYPAGDNIRDKATTKSSVVEIPTTGYIYTGWRNLLLKPRIWHLLHRRQPVFLSFLVHNWQAIKPDGSPDIKFLGNLSSFLRMLSRNGARFLSWTEVKEVYDSMHEK